MLTFRRIVLVLFVILPAVSILIAGIYYGADHAFGHSHNGTFTVTTSP